MKRMLRPAGALLLLSALFMPAAHAYLTVTGNGTSPATANGTSFVTTPTAAVFYRPTGEYFFGLNWNVASPATYSICYGNYRTPDVAPTLTALGSGTGLNGISVHNLAVVPYSSSATYALVQADVASPTILAVASGAAAGVGALTTTQVSAITKTSLTPVTTGAAAGAGAINAVDINITGGIRGLCASNDLGTAGMNIAFVGSKANGGTSNPFGAGINPVASTATDGLVGILVGRDATGAPTIVATGGSSPLTAQTFDLTNTGSYLISSTVGLITTCSTGIAGNRYADYPALWYDSILNRLYVGTTINSAASGTVGTFTGVISVGIYPVTVVPNTSITIGAQLAPFTTFSNIPATATGIVALRQDNAVSNASAQMLRTMHTSTGFVYLLVNGGTVIAGLADAAATVTGENIYAVPLVGTASATAAAVGTFADIRTGDYLTQAGAAGSFALSTSAAYQVGGSGTLPITPGANVVKDMFVDGDTLYVAAGDGPATATNNPGVYKSQAVFNQNGQIDHWTDWQRVTPNDMAGQTVGGTAANGTDGRADFVAVDGYTGHVWVTNATSLKSNVTQWSQPAVLTQQSGLPAAVNAALPGGLCYSVLDLNTSVTGWGGTTPARITAFGGQEKVCFAITGSASALPAAMNGTYQQPTMQLQTTGDGNVYDYTQTNTFITTSLPAGAGAVISLAYSGWNPDTQTGANVGMFFAGCAGTATTPPGLYAWCWSQTQAGFDPITTQLNDLQNVFNWGTYEDGWSWQLIPNVQGMPVKIASLGGGLHVLTRTNGLDRIYSTPKRGTGVALNSSFVVTASSGVAPTAGSTNSSLASVTQIYDFVISVSPLATAATPAANASEQLLMLTNDGIYTTSNASGMSGGTSANTNNLNQLNAGWVRIAAPTSLGLLSDYLEQPGYNRSPQTFWFGNWTVNPTVPGVYNNYIWYQMSRNSINPDGFTLANLTTYNADPTVTATFNGATSFNQTTAPTIYATFPVNARLFYNDGSRRFFVQKNPANDGAYQVLVLPYNLYDYNITANGKAPMSDAAVAQAGAFYWMSPIGDTGRLMMGTSKGVIALQ